MPGSENEGARLATGPRTDIDSGQLAQALEPLAFDKRIDILRYLTEPHYLEEIASHLGVARQTAKKHVDKLLEIGVIEGQQGKRPSGPVVEYVVVPQRLFEISEEFAKLGVLQPAEEERDLSRTQAATQVPAAGAEATGPALVLAHGMGRGRRHRLVPPGPWTIGRAPERDVALEYDPFVSNQHAEITRDEGDLVLADTYSTNGTFVNGDRMDRGGSHVLSPGDIIELGRSVLVFQP